MRYLCFLLFTAFSTTLHAQHLTGEVREALQQSPLPFASVSLFSSGKTTPIRAVLTDSAGRFSIPGLRNGRYRLVVRSLGYSPLEKPEVMVPGPSDLGILLLSPGEALLRELRVTGQKPAFFNQPDRQIYRAAEFQSARGGTAADVLKNMPSVSMNAQGEINVRGMAGFLLLLDGKPVQGDPAFLLGQLPANSIETVEIITTPSARFDADGKGGIIQVTTKHGALNSRAVQFSLLGGLPSTGDFGNRNKPLRFGGYLSFQYKHGKWDLSAGGAYNRNDLAGRREGDVWTIIGNRQTRFPSVGERSTRKENYSLRGSAGYRLSGNQTIKAGISYGIRDEYRRADITYDNTATDLHTGAVIGKADYFNANLVRKKGTFLLADLDYTLTLARQSVLTVSGLLERDQFSGFTRNLNIRTPESVDTLQYTLNTNTRPLTGYRFKASYEVPLWKGRLESGYQFRSWRENGEYVYLEKNANYQPWGTIPGFGGHVRVENTIHSLYSQYVVKPAANWSVTAGLRYEDANRQLTTDSSGHRLHLQNLFPSALVSWQWTDRWQARAGYSRRVQRASSPELNPLPEREHSETLEQGDARLLPEFVQLAEAGLVRSLKKGTLFGNLYYQDVRNVVNRVNSVYADTILNRIYTNAGRARRLGMEAGLTLAPVTWWKLYAGGNVYHYRILGSLFGGTVANASWVYSLNVNSGFGLGDGWNLQLTVNYLSRRATAQGEDSRFFTPALSLRKDLLRGRASLLFTWQNIDLGRLGANEQRITTRGRDFFTTTNYVYEKDVLQLQFSFNLSRKVGKFAEAEFGDREF